MDRVVIYPYWMQEGAYINIEADDVIIDKENEDIYVMRNANVVAFFHIIEIKGFYISEVKK